MYESTYVTGQFSTEDVFASAPLSPSYVAKPLSPELGLAPLEPLPAQYYNYYNNLLCNMENRLHSVLGALYGELQYVAGQVGVSLNNNSNAGQLYTMLKSLVPLSASSAASFRAVTDSAGNTTWASAINTSVLSAGSAGSFRVSTNTAGATAWTSAVNTSVPAAASGSALRIVTNEFGSTTWTTAVNTSAGSFRVATNTAGATAWTSAAKTSTFAANSAYSIRVYTNDRGGTSWASAGSSIVASASSVASFRSVTNTAGNTGWRTAVDSSISLAHTASYVRIRTMSDHEDTTVMTSVVDMRHLSASTAGSAMFIREVTNTADDTAWAPWLTSVRSAGSAGSFRVRTNTAGGTAWTTAARSSTFAAESASFFRTVTDYSGNTKWTSAAPMPVAATSASVANVVRDYLSSYVGIRFGEEITSNITSAGLGLFVKTILLTAQYVTYNSTTNPIHPLITIRGSSTTRRNYCPFYVETSLAEISSLCDFRMVYTNGSGVIVQPPNYPNQTSDALAFVSTKSGAANNSSGLTVPQEVSVTIRARYNMTLRAWTNAAFEYPNTTEMWSYYFPLAFASQEAISISGLHSASSLHSLFAGVGMKPNDSLMYTYRFMYMATSSVTSMSRFFYEPCPIALLVRASNSSKLSVYYSSTTVDLA